MELVTTAEIAKWLGVSETSITTLAQRGIVVKPKRGRYDLQASVLKYTAHLRETAAGRGGEKGVLDLTAERARHAKEQADKLALDNAKTRGEILIASEVEREWSDILIRVRAAMLAVTSRVRQQISSIDAAQALLIDREIRDALKALADDDSDDTPEGIGEVETTPAN